MFSGLKKAIITIEVSDKADAVDFVDSTMRNTLRIERGVNPGKRLMTSGPFALKYLKPSEIADVIAQDKPEVLVFEDFDERKHEAELDIVRKAITEYFECYGDLVVIMVILKH